MQFHTAKLFLFQVAFFERNLQQSPAMHLNILSEGLEGAKSFLDLYLWLPPKSEMTLTNSEWIQLSFGVTQAAKFAIVSRMPSVEVQTREIRYRLNIDHVFRHLTLRIGALVGRAGEGNKQKDIFYYYEQRTRKIQRWYEKMVKLTGSKSLDTRPSVGSYGSSQEPSPLQAYDSPSSHASAPSPIQPLPNHSSQVPISATFSHQRPISYSSSPAGATLEEPHLLPNEVFQDPSTSVGMVPMTSYSTYGSVPSIAFPDLMNAPGWDTLFTVPMEDMSWLVDVTQGYNGMNVASSPSDPGWGDTGA